jgi:hypothetical protein
LFGRQRVGFYRKLVQVFFRSFNQTAQLSSARDDCCHKQIAKAFDYFCAKCPQVMSLVKQMGQAGQCGWAVLDPNSSDESLHQLLRYGSQEYFQVRVADGLTTIGDCLIKQAQGITHASFAGPSQRYEASVLEGQLILSCHMPKPLDDFGSGDTPKIVMLASRENRRRDLMNFCGRKNEDDMRRWFFKRL